MSLKRCVLCQIETERKNVLKKYESFKVDKTEEIEALKQELSKIHAILEI